MLCNLILKILNVLHYSRTNGKTIFTTQQQDSFFPFFMYIPSIRAYIYPSTYCSIIYLSCPIFIAVEGGIDIMFLFVTVFLFNMVWVVLEINFLFRSVGFFLITGIV